MNGENSTVTPEYLEQVFVALKGLQGLAQGGARRPVLYSEVYHYVHGSHAGDSNRVEMALKSDMRVRRLFRQIVDKQRVATSPSAAVAQDTTTIEQRVGDGFILKFRPSHAKGDQVYVVLEIQASLGISDGQAFSLIAVNESSASRINFPPVVDGRTQAILLESDERLKMLRNPELELNLIPN
jgi:hypothetical protein